MDILNGISRHANPYLGHYSGWLNQYPNLALGPVGLVALASLDTVAIRTALTGTSSLLDALVLCPGLHKQRDAPDLSKGEYPACAAMTSGYVFRVENEATVLYLQKVGRSGHLTTLAVSSVDGSSQNPTNSLQNQRSGDMYSVVGPACYVVAAALTVMVSILDLFIEDWWALVNLSLFMVARLINVILIRRRAAIGWKGASEPGVTGDLLILLSQDRWIRMQGAVDDLKAVTSGQWLREANFTENCFGSFATLLVYLNATLTVNAERQGNFLILMLLFCSALLLEVLNEHTRNLRMYGRTVAITGKPKPYKRRLDLAYELIEQTGRDDWAIRLGMIQPKTEDASTTKAETTKIM